MRLRLQKFIAQSGKCSRRAAETLIREGKVLVNHKEVAQVGDSIDPSVDTVCVEGKRISPKELVYFIFNKPLKVLCSRSDPQGRSCYHELLNTPIRHLNYAGRLDFMSEGLLILSNDGLFNHRLTHPRYGIRKHYHVWVNHTRGLNAFLHKVVSKGIKDHGEILKAETAHILEAKGDNVMIEIVLLDGKNREIRRMMSHGNTQVQRLLRFQVGPISLDGVKTGKCRSFNPNERNFVKKLITILPQNKHVPS
jgi:23S rRNA pseudouridine2605 synthase